MIEIMAFGLIDGADEVAFVAADKRLQSGFAYQQPGLLRRTTARGEHGQWAVIDIWRSPADADACAAKWESDRIAADFMGFVDKDTVRVARFFELD